jgi:hypothetical protein
MRTRWAVLALVAVALPTGSAGAAQVDPLSLLVVPRSELAGLPGEFKIELLSGPTNNARAANDSFDPGDSAAELTKAGRVSGYTLFYGDPSLSALRRGRGLIEVGTTLDLFRTTAQAREFAAKTRRVIARLRGRNLDGVVLDRSTTFAVRGFPRGAIGLRLVTRVGQRRIYSTYVIVQANTLLLESAVTRADKVSGDGLAIALARALVQRLGAYAANRLRAAPVRLPRRPAAEQPTKGTPDLSKMVLRARDVGRAATIVSQQGYIDDLTALASYSRQLRIDPRSGLFVVRSGVSLQRSAAEARGRMLIIRSIFTGPDGRDTLIQNFTGTVVKATRPRLDAVRSPSVGDEAFSVSASFTANGRRVRVELVYVRRGRTLGTILLAGAARAVGAGRGTPLARTMARRMPAPSRPKPKLVA